MRPGPLARFALLQADACAFPALLLAGIALSHLLPGAVPRYDALLAYGAALTALFWALGRETGRDVAVIAAFHAVGLAFELFKVHAGSWSYPEEAWTKVLGVPLYGGFLYAAVGSYVVRSWTVLRLELAGYRPAATAAVAALAYANFYTHHWLPDLRAAIALALTAVTWGAWVEYSVGRTRYRMPLAVSFVLIGFFLWVAENAATLAGAWRYPHQAEGWTMVHAGKFGSWALLVTVAFVLVAASRSGPQPGRGGRRLVGDHE